MWDFFELVTDFLIVVLGFSDRLDVEIFEEQDLFLQFVDHDFQVRDLLSQLYVLMTE